MKKTLLIVSLFLTSFLLPIYGLTQSTMSVVDLKCEYQSEPIGIDIELPCFNWKLSDTENTRGQKQTAYQILVATNKMQLDKDKGDLWDSQIITSDQSTLITYSGAKLRSNQTCYWKVRAYDKNKKATAWSSVARFSMGLLDRNDWKGAWIKHPNATDEKHIWFRKNFTLKKRLNTAYIHVASMGYHELYVNGKKVDNSILAPVLSRLDKRTLYVTYDIKKMLHVGKNTIAVWYGPGWSRYEFFKKLTTQAILVQMDAKMTNGKIVTLQTDTSWKCLESSSKNTGDCKWGDNGGEYVDATKYITDWNSPTFNDSQWPFAKDTTLNVVLSAQSMNPTQIIETILTKNITDTPNTYKIDMGENFTGWIEIKMNGMAKGDKVKIMVADDPTTLQDFGQQNIYVCKGEANEKFCNRFNYNAGRYINIQGLKQKPQFADITGYAISTDIQRTGKFSCSNDLFNQIYETDLWTYRMCTTEGFTADCPHRERMGYGEETFASAWGCGFPNYEVSAFYTKHVRDWTDVQEDNGWIHHTAPQVNKHYGGAMWSSAGLNVSYEMYKNNGDLRILETIYPSAKKWLDFLHIYSAEGVLTNYFKGDSKDWGKFLGDWAAPGDRRERGDTPEGQYFNNCVYAMNLADFIAIAKVLNKPEDVLLYTKRLKDLKAQINALFFDKNKNIYSLATQVQMAFALLADIVPAEYKTTVQTNFIKAMESTPYLDMGSSGLPVLLKYLIEETDGSKFLNEYLSKKTQPSYGYFLARGETTWPEFWSVNVRSRIHTCYTGIASWFMKSLGGIKPDPLQPGYQSFIIKPTPADGLNYVNAETESPYGTIRSSWRKEGDKFILNISVPVNSKATVYIPTSSKNKIFESGKELYNTTEIKILKQELSNLILEVPAGNYEFISK